MALTASIGAADGCPSHSTSSSSSSSPFSTSPSLRHQVCVGVGGEGEGDACFTQPHSRPLANNCRLVAACLCWWLRGGGGCVTFTGCACGCTSSPFPCCAVLLVGASMSRAAHTQPRHHHISHGIVVSLPLLPSPLSVTAHIVAAAGGQTAGHTSTRDDDDDTEVCATVCATRGVDAWRAFRPLHVLQPG